MLCRIERSKEICCNNSRIAKCSSRLWGAQEMPHKKIPRRTTRSAEDYAKKVRMEPPKATRQEPPLVAKGKNNARQHNPDKKVSSAKKPFLRSLCRSVLYLEMDIPDISSSGPANVNRAGAASYSPRSNSIWNRESTFRKASRHQRNRAEEKGITTAWSALGSLRAFT
jgi:hypothetical protein